MKHLFFLLGISHVMAHSLCSRRVRSWFLCICACFAQVGHAQAAASAPVFEFGFAHVDQSNADNYLIESSGVRKYSEWQRPPITYWGPVANNQIGTLVYRFVFPVRASQVWLKAHSPLWNVGPGFGRGASALEVSKDGQTWFAVWNAIDPLQWGQGFTIDGFLPQGAAETSELWVRIKLLVTEAPNSSYTTAQFGRSTSAASENIFEIRAYGSSSDTDGDQFPDVIESHYKSDPNHSDSTPNSIRQKGRVLGWGASGRFTNGFSDVISVSAGEYHFVALRANGAVFGWGDNSAGQLNIPEFGKPVVAVSAGAVGFHNLAVLSDGTVRGWGLNNYGQASIPAGLTNVVAVSAGREHSVALKADGTVVAWGANSVAQIAVPSDLRDVVKVVSGPWHNVALKRNGSAVRWGYHDGPDDEIPSDLSEVFDIAVAHRTSFAVLADKSLVSWGKTIWGSVDAELDQIPSNLGAVLAVGNTYNVAMAVNQAGRLIKWGNGAWADGKNFGHFHDVPASLEQVFAFAGGLLDSAALTTDSDFDDDGLEDIYETGTGNWVSATDTGTDPSNPDTDGDGLSDGVETSTGAYISPTDTGTDPNLSDTDRDGLPDGAETATSVYVGANDTGTDPNNPDTSSDGILDGEAVLWNFNPLTDHTQVLAFLRHAAGVQSGRFALYTEGSIMDLNLGGVMLQKTGTQASVRFKVLSKMDLRDPAWADRGTYLLPPIDMPGSKGFLRIRAEQP